MEVRFRPLPRSTLARPVRPGQVPSEAGQNFGEVVEGVVGAENSPEKNSGAGRKQETPLWTLPPTSDSEAGEEVAKEVPEGDTEKKAPLPADKTTPNGKPLGTRIDMTV
ncbi:MAG: hypothetical protein JSV16_16745 [Candidatus Hydrogenedentota bacterium]|nr:MAG: hypothetical protein JSV16_16745 [Candidatus Hydrogenedentota bacterium]